MSPRLEGHSIAALARDYGVSHTAVADLMPDHITIEENAPAPELPVALDMRGKVAGFLRTADLNRQAGTDMRGRLVNLGNDGYS